MEMMVSDGTSDLSNLRAAVPSAPCTDSAAAGLSCVNQLATWRLTVQSATPTVLLLHAAPLRADLMSSVAVHFKGEEFEPLQLNIFNQDSRHFNIVSEVCHHLLVPVSITFE